MNQAKKPKVTAVDAVGILCRPCNHLCANKKEYDAHYSSIHPTVTDISYTCVACKKTIATYRSFRDHCYIAHIKGRYKCDVCLMNFSKTSVLEKHKLSHSRKFQCQQCKDDFTSTKDLKLHQLTHPPIKKFKKDKFTTINSVGGIRCAPCNVIYASKLEYDAHYLNTHPVDVDVTYSCVICYKEVVGYKGFHDHCYKFHVKGTFNCTYCPHKFKNQTSLDDHIRLKHLISNQPDPQQSPVKLKPPKTVVESYGILCSPCNATFANKRDYDEHYTSAHPVAEDIVYTCVICRKDIVGYRSFRGHCYTAHVIKDRFRCQTCSKNFSKQSALDEHQRIKHQSVCQLCSKEFTSSQELRIHQMVHKEKGPPYPCRKCEQPIATVDQCLAHCDQHAVTQYVCPMCSEHHCTKLEARQHLTTHFIGETLQDTFEEVKAVRGDCVLDILDGIGCHICNQTYKTRSSFECHYKYEHGEEKVVYGCNVCGLHFDVYLSFFNHCYNHTLVGKFKCANCGKCFPRASLLASHAVHCDRASRDAPCDGPCDGSCDGTCDATCDASCDRRPPRPFRCPRCPAAYADEHNYKSHLKKAHDVAENQCPEADCGRTFAKPRQLLLHQRAHSPEPCCTLCARRLPALAAAAAHLDAHRALQLACPVCARNVHAKRVRAHVEAHFQSVYHVCKICGKAYDAKHRLLEHIQTHSAAPHACTVCAKTFTRLVTLRQHLNTHTGHKYLCELCQRGFTSYPNWWKHTKIAHKADPNQMKKGLRLVKEPVDKGSKETGLDVSYEFVLDDDEKVDLDAIEPSLLDDLELDCSSNSCSTENGFDDFELDDIAPLPAAPPAPASPAQYPPEYGPDYPHPDDHMLPHIDPLLTLNTGDQQYPLLALNNGGQDYPLLALNTGGSEYNLLTVNIGGGSEYPLDIAGGLCRMPEYKLYDSFDELPYRVALQ